MNTNRNPLFELSLEKNTEVAARQSLLYGTTVTPVHERLPSSSEPKKVRQTKPTKRTRVTNTKPAEANPNPQEANTSILEKTPVYDTRPINSSEQAGVKSKTPSRQEAQKKRREIPSTNTGAASSRRNRRPLKVSTKDSEKPVGKPTHSSENTNRNPKKDRAAPSRERRVQKPERGDPTSKYKALIRELPTDIPLEKPLSVRSALTVETTDTNKSRSRSGSSRLQFDGAITTSDPTHSEQKIKQRQLITASKVEQQRTVVGTATLPNPSVANCNVDDTRSNALAQGQAMHAQPSASTNRNQRSRNTDKKMLPITGANTEVKKEATTNLYANEEGAERAPDIDPPERIMLAPLPLTCSRIVWITIFCSVILVAIIAIPCIVLLGGPDIDFPKLSKAKGVVSTISTDICNESVPKSGECTSKDSQYENQGGELCNLLAKSMINTTVYGDIGLINGGICKKNILAPELTASSIKKAIASEKLMLVEISGADLVDVLTDALASTFGDSGNPKAYPYASGLRYNIEANMPPSERLSSIEVNRGLRGDEWEPIDIRRFYKVVTTESLASHSMGYASFNNVIDDWKSPLHIRTGDAFYNYAKTHSSDQTWSELPSSEYSTQYFVGENEEATIAKVPSRICHAMIPGQPESEFCSVEDVARGGEVCNLLSWMIYDQNFGIDMVLLPGKSCAGDIKEGNFVESSFDIVLSENKPLVTVDVLGSGIVLMINDSISSALGNGLPGNYPYGAGLKFDVITGSSSAYNIRVLTSGGRWDPIVGTETYTVATASDVFRTLPSKDMGTTMKEEILDYVEDWGVLYKPPSDKVSTQSYA